MGSQQSYTNLYRIEMCALLNQTNVEKKTENMKENEIE